MLKRQPWSLMFILAGALLVIPSFHAGAAADSLPDLQLVLRLDKSAYRPGEAVRVNIELIDQTGKWEKVRALNADSVLFYFGRRGEPERMERQAVVSANEDMKAFMTPAPGQPEKRGFVLTRLTEFTGPLVLQAQYLPGGDAAQTTPRIYSNAVDFQVDGQRLFQRDPGGFIVKDDAMRVACAAVGGAVAEAQAVFIRDEAGFYKWYVNVKTRGGAPAGLLIDPYLGTLWHKARPFDPRLALDPRHQRPPGLPTAQIPARAPKQ